MNGTGGLKYRRHTGPIPGRQRTLRGALAALALAGAATAGCYEAKPLRLSVVTPATARDCALTADQVFFDAAYVRLNDVYGPDLFYTPRVNFGGPDLSYPPSPPRGSLAPQMTVRAPAGLGWGIGVWLRPPESGGHTCTFVLEALSADLAPGTQRVYTSQRGTDFDRALQEMVTRLTAAFEQTPPPG